MLLEHGTVTAQGGLRARVLYLHSLESSVYCMSRAHGGGQIWLRGMYAFLFLFLFLQKGAKEG